MKFNCGLSKEERAAAKRDRRTAQRQWHTWFAWFPVRVGHRDCRWLETVERQVHRRVANFGLHIDQLTVNKSYRVIPKL